MSSLYPSSVAVQPALCGAWSETPKTGFVVTDSDISAVYLDTGYPHDSRADKDSYPHDGRADKDSYPHDRRADKDSYPHDRHKQYITNILC